MATGTHRPMRADARRNYERLLAAGEAAFTQRGPDASLEDIARQAGVGIGTLYRHFPTRNALVEAVYLDRIESLCALADELADEPSPGDALTTWLRAFAQHTATYRGLKAVIKAAAQDTGSPLSDVHLKLRSAVGGLLVHAKEARAVRSDLEVRELLRIVHAVTVAAEEALDDANQAERLLTLVLDGLRTPSA